MTEKPKERHNGHRDEPTGAERVRSGFDRRRNWGDSIENVYRRIDHRLSELVQEGAKQGRTVESRAARYFERYPARVLAACVLSGLLLGIWMGRMTKD